MIKVSKPEYDFFRKGSDPEQQNCFASSLVSIFKDALGRGCEGCEEAMQKKRPKETGYKITEQACFAW